MSQCDTEVASISESLATARAFAIAQALLSHPHCFLPSTVFRRRDGHPVRAAQLPKEDGIELAGPNSTWVSLLNVRRHQQQELDVVRFELGNFNFTVTADHRLLVVASANEPEPLEAGSIHRGSRIYNGEGYLQVIDVNNKFEASH